MAHNVHFLLTKADSAKEAADNVLGEIASWGDDNNWRCIGGIASEDGTDDVENHQNARWALSFMQGKENIPHDGTYYSKTVAYIKEMITGKLTLLSDSTQHIKITDAIEGIITNLRTFNEEKPDDDIYLLLRTGNAVKQLFEIVNARQRLKSGCELAELNAWEFDQTGFTDLSDEYEGGLNYLVYLDMHS